MVTAGILSFRENSHSRTGNRTRDLMISRQRPLDHEAGHHSHHRDNVTAPHGRPNLRSRLHFCHAQEGRPRSPQGHVGDMCGYWEGEKKEREECLKKESYNGN